MRLKKNLHTHIITKDRDIKREGFSRTTLLNERRPNNAQSSSKTRGSLETLSPRRGAPKSGSLCITPEET